jgi:hypothetical protein
MAHDEAYPADCRPLNVCVKPGSAADKAYRKLVTMPRSPAVNPDVIAPGITPSPEEDLIFRGGHVIPDLVFTNFFVGGAASWQSSDVQNIDQKLAAAMSDRRLNNVMLQYFPSRMLITSTARPSQFLPGQKPAVVSQGDVENMVRSLFSAGQLQGFRFGSTVFNFVLPPGTILNSDAAPTGGQIHPTARAQQAKPGDVVIPSEEASSLVGLGGYHGSIHAALPDGRRTTIYYAVGVFSEQLPNGQSNGIPVFDQPWKNVVATFYHELNEARTDPDVEDAIKTGDDSVLGWVSQRGEEVGDFPVEEATPLSKVFQEVELADGTGTVPVQFEYSNFVHGPEGPIDQPHPRS